MPKRSEADKVRASVEFWQEEIAKAYEASAGDEEKIDAPFTVAMRWLTAVLKKEADKNPRQAVKDYRHATDQLSAFAIQIQGYTHQGTQERKDGNR